LPGWKNVVFKLLVTLGVFLLVALELFWLRHHRLEITSQCATIQSEIKNREETLLGQRVQIARETNPWALASSLEAAGSNPGDALITRDGRTPATVRRTQNTPAVETDLLAPLVDPDGGHNPSRPRE
jgi:hypothetical protein